MGDHLRSPSTIDFYGILGTPPTATIREMCKAYKSLVTKWYPDKNPSKRDDPQTKIKQIEQPSKDPKEQNIQEKPMQIDYEVTTPPPSDLPSPVGSSHRGKSMDDIFSQPAILLKSMSKKSQSPVPEKSRSKSTGRCMSRTPSSNPNPKCSSRSTSPAPADKSRSKSVGRRRASEPEIPSVMRSPTRKRSTTPIVYSQSTAWRIPSPIERKLECSLEELCFGCVKKINITRDVISNGIIKQVEETLKINMKPGWRKGTKITFDGKGDEKPGYLPADIIFSIEEKHHPLFTRQGDDLQYGVEIPLLQALTGCKISVPLIGGEQMCLSFDEIVIFPGFEKVIQGQGMPKKIEGKRGDLRIKFLVEFPSELSDEQRIEASRILRDCS